jgi:hypothetical protein
MSTSSLGIIVCAVKREVLGIALRKLKGRDLKIILSLSRGMGAK